jgi:hypothetical protein
MLNSRMDGMLRSDESSSQRPPSTGSSCAKPWPC